jgi:hypothetical protein
LFFHSLFDLLCLLVCQICCAHIVFSRNRLWSIALLIPSPSCTNNTPLRPC